MNELIDIHSHILPGLDDGSKDLHQTLNMIKIAYSEGVRAIIATPHYHENRVHNDISKVKNSLTLVCESIADDYPDMRLYMGSEIYYSHEVVGLLNEKIIPTMANSRYVLVEFSPMSDYRYLKEGLNNLILEGYIPILAHCERYKDVVKDLSRVEELINMGAYMQIDSISVNGTSDRKYKKIAKKLLKKRLVHYIATDCHGDISRTPRIRKTLEYINKKHGEEYTKTLLIDNPSKILSGEYI